MRFAISIKIMLVSVAVSLNQQMLVPIQIPRVKHNN